MPENKQPGKGKWHHVLVWSVISAAFIGPGTVTTALTAGANFKLSLLWTILLAVVACLLIQEAVARLTAVSGKTLGELIAARYPFNNGFPVRLGVFLAIFMGCTAYQAGNLKGALSGFQLLLPVGNVTGMVLLLALIIPVLWFPGLKRQLKFLGFMVLAMALVFLMVVLKTDYHWRGLLTDGFLPSIPLGADILVIAMLGTTIVPYNLFLGAGLAKNQPLKELRFGLIISILLGGFITFIILLAGTLNRPDPSFADVMATITSKGGSWSGIFFALGLALAGFTSAVTAPLAAAITFETLLGREFPSAWIFRSIWLVVVLTGFLIGISSWQPIPVIIIAQAINGLLLPFLAVYIFLLLHDRRIVPAEFRNPGWLDGIFALVTYIIVTLGLFHFFRIVTTLIGYTPGTRNLYLLAGLISFLLCAVTFRKIFFKRAV